MNGRTIATCARANMMRLAVVSVPLLLSGCFGRGQTSCGDEVGRATDDASGMNCLRSCGSEEPCPEGYSCRGLGLCVNDDEYAALQNQNVDQGDVCEGPLVNGIPLICAELEVSATLDDGEKPWGVILVTQAPEFEAVDALSALYSIQIVRAEGDDAPFSDELVLNIGFDADQGDQWIFRVSSEQEPTGIDQVHFSGQVHADNHHAGLEDAYFLGRYRMD